MAPDVPIKSRIKSVLRRSLGLSRASPSPRPDSQDSSNLIIASSNTKNNNGNLPHRPALPPKDPMPPSFSYPSGVQPYYYSFGGNNHHKRNQSEPQPSGPSSNDVGQQRPRHQRHKSLGNDSAFPSDMARPRATTMPTRPTTSGGGSGTMDGLLRGQMLADAEAAKMLSTMPGYRDGSSTTIASAAAASSTSIATPAGPTIQVQEQQTREPASTQGQTTQRKQQQDQLHSRLRPPNFYIPRKESIGVALSSPGNYVGNHMSEGYIHGQVNRIANVQELDRHIESQLTFRRDEEEPIDEEDEEEEEKKQDIKQEENDKEETPYQPQPEVKDSFVTKQRHEQVDNAKQQQPQPSQKGYIPRDEDTIERYLRPPPLDYARQYLQEESDTYYNHQQEDEDDQQQQQHRWQNSYSPALASPSEDPALSSPTGDMTVSHKSSFDYDSDSVYDDEDTSGGEEEDDMRNGGLAHQYQHNTHQHQPQFQQYTGHQQHARVASYGYAFPKVVPSDTVDRTVTHAPAALRERVYRPVHEIVRKPVVRDVHHYDEYYRVQPVLDVKVLPPRHIYVDARGHVSELSGGNGAPARDGNSNNLPHGIELGQPF